MFHFPDASQPSHRIGVVLVVTTWSWIIRIIEIVCKISSSSRHVIICNNIVIGASPSKNNHKQKWVGGPLGSSHQLCLALICVYTYIYMLFLTLKLFEIYIYIHTDDVQCIFIASWSSWHLDCGKKCVINFISVDLLSLQTVSTVIWSNPARVKASAICWCAMCRVYGLVRNRFLMPMSTYCKYGDM